MRRVILAQPCETEPRHRLFIFKRSCTSLLRGILPGDSIALNLTPYSLSAPITRDVSAYVTVSKQT